MVALSISNVVENFKKNKLEAMEGEVSGWVKSVRLSGKEIAFVMLNDGSIVQNFQLVVLNKDIISNFISKLTSGSSITAHGLILKSSAQGQEFEMKIAENHDFIKIHGLSDPIEYPLAKTAFTLEYLRKLPHLRCRTTYYQCLTRIRHVCMISVHEFYDSQGFYCIHTPIITTSDCEGAGELFRVMTDPDLVIPKPNHGIPKQTFFSKDAFLTCSGQLHVEGPACGLSKTYTFGPTFRAEKSDSNKHLSEFWMIEPEITHTNLEELATLIHSNIKYVAEQVLKRCFNEIKYLQQYALDDKNSEGLLPTFISGDKKTWLENRINMVINEKPILLPYKKAIEQLHELLCKKGDKQEAEKCFIGEDLTSYWEQLLVTELYPGKMVFVTRWPHRIKAFYMRRSNEDEETCESLDCLIPQVGEVAGGSVREERYEKLLSAIDQNNLNKEEYYEYLQLRKFGTVPHAGFGIGFDRMVTFLSGAKHIKDTIPYPRAYGTIYG